jgi:hypothetical protein
MIEYTCSNYITALGSKEDIAAFREFVKSDTSALSFNSITPIPDEIKNIGPMDIKPSILAKYGALDVLGYREKHWDSTREADSAELVDLLDMPTDIQSAVSVKAKIPKADQVINYKFNTPDQPPIGIYKTMSEKFPNMVFHLVFDIDTEKESKSGFALSRGGKLLGSRQIPMSYRQIQLHLEPFNKTWYSILDEDKFEEEE